MPLRLQNFLLLGTSLYFYACFDMAYVPFLIFVALSTFLVAKVEKRKKLWLWIIISANVLLWFIIKFHYFIFAYLDQFLGIVKLPPIGDKFSILVPVGISYYILQAIAYVLDVHRNKIEPETKFWKYLLFLSYFPAIVQGPISRYDKLMPELTKSKKFNYDTFANNLLLVLLGLVKKMVIADRIAIYANYCFNNYDSLSGLTLYLGAIAYSLQLYTDFSGCVDICRGMSGMLGIELAENFNHPYMATSIKEFWGKWHISLSSWLKDYIYIPLGGNRNGALRKNFNLLATFTVSGIWHGFGMHYIVWGALQAIFQIISGYTINLRTTIKQWLKIEKGSLSERFYKHFITLHLILISWIFFRAENLTIAFRYICNMFTEWSILELMNNSLFGQGVNFFYFIVLFIHIAVLFMSEYYASKHKSMVLIIRESHIFIRWSIYFVLIYDLLLFGVYGSGYDTSGFLYGGF